MAGKPRTPPPDLPPAPEPEQEEATVWTLVDDKGREFTTGSAVAYFNLKSQGYRDKDPEAAAKLTAQAAEKATDPAYARAADPTTYRSARR